MNLPVFVLLAVFLLIAFRQVVLPGMGIWQIMLAGALAVLLTGQISPRRALEAIDPDVMLFLFGMFVVGAALEESGYLSHLSSKLLRARSVDSLVLRLLFLMGFSSALLMNDTLAIIGTPLVLLLARRHGLPPQAPPPNPGLWGHHGKRPQPHREPPEPPHRPPPGQALPPLLQVPLPSPPG